MCNVYVYVYAKINVHCTIVYTNIPFPIGFLADCLLTKNVAETRHRNENTHEHIDSYSNFNSHKQLAMWILNEIVRNHFGFIFLFEMEISHESQPNVPNFQLLISLSLFTMNIVSTHCHLYPQQQRPCVWSILCLAFVCWKTLFLLRYAIPHHYIYVYIPYSYSSLTMTMTITATSDDDDGGDNNNNYNHNGIGYSTSRSSHWKSFHFCCWCFRKMFKFFHKCFHSLNYDECVLHSMHVNNTMYASEIFGIERYILRRTPCIAHPKYSHNLYVYVVYSLPSVVNFSFHVRLLS